MTTFFLFVFAAACIFANAYSTTSRTKTRRQREYNDKLMKKSTININDNIYYNQYKTPECMLEICPLVNDLIYKDHTKLYEIEGHTKESYHETMIQNVTHAFLSEVYNGRNYPTYRPDVTLEVTFKDIKTYNNKFCSRSYRKMLTSAETAIKSQKVYEYHASYKNPITIEHKPQFDKNDYEFQKPLCPIIQNYKMMNASFSSHDNFVNALVQNITEVYMMTVYTPENFQHLYNPSATLQPPTETEINQYYTTHCKHLREYTPFQMWSGVATMVTAALVTFA
jgi:hypothetical protein